MDWLLGTATERLDLSQDLDLLDTLGRLAAILDAVGGSGGDPGGAAGVDPVARARQLLGAAARTAAATLGDLPALLGPSPPPAPEIARIRAALSGLALRLPRGTAEGLALLLQRPSRLLAAAGGPLPVLEWSVRFATGSGDARLPAGGLGLALGGAAEGQLGFALAPRLPEGLAAPAAGTPLAVRLRGEIRCGVAAGLPVRLGTVGAAADAAGGATLAYYLVAPDDAPLAAALAACLRGLVDPFDLAAVDRALAAGTLLGLGIETQGTLALGGTLGIGLALTPLGGASADLELGFRTRREGSFALLVSPTAATAPQAAGAGRVLAELHRTRAVADQRQAALGVQADLGPGLGAGLDLELSELLGRLLPRLLAQAGPAKNLLDQLDACLPPSRCARAAIAQRLGEALGSERLQGLAGAALGIGTGAADLQPLERRLQAAIDGLPGLWQGAATALAGEAVRRALAPWSLAPGPRGELERALLPVAQGAIAAVHGRLGQELERIAGDDARYARLRQALARAGAPVAAATADAPARVAAVRGEAQRLLDRFQRTLAGLVPALERAARVRLDARWRLEERSGGGESRLQRIALAPDAPGAGALYRQIVTGSLDRVMAAAGAPDAPVRLLEGSLARFAGLDRSQGFELAVLDLDLGELDLLDARVEIATDSAGNLRVFARAATTTAGHGLGEAREFRAVNVFELAQARRTRRMTLSLSLSHLDDDLRDREIARFFAGLEAPGIGLLPPGQASAALTRIAAATATATPGPGPGIRRPGILQVWLELDAAAMTRLLALDRPRGLDPGAIYRTAVDAMLAGLAATGSAAVLNNLTQLVRTEGMGDSPRAALLALADPRQRAALAPNPGDSDFFGGSRPDFERLVRISDRALGLGAALADMRAICAATPGVEGWDLARYRRLQDRIDDRIRYWVKGEIEDRASALLGGDRIGPYALAFFKTVADLAWGGDGAGGPPPLLASVRLGAGEAEQEVPVALPALPVPGGPGETGASAPVPGPIPEPPPEPPPGPAPATGTAPVPPTPAGDGSSRPPSRLRPTPTPDPNGRPLMADFIFPFRTRPLKSFESEGRNFGARRDQGKRLHAGCDLVMPVDTPILAMADGKVIRGPYPFYEGTYALEVQHGKRVVRYGEIRRRVPDGVGEGTTVRQGQTLAYVGRLDSGSHMLHLEVYKGTQSGRLNSAGNKFMRRGDLENPTDLLKRAPLIHEAAPAAPGRAGQVAAPPSAPIRNPAARVNDRVIQALNVRQQPSAAAAVLGQIPRGTAVEILDLVTGDSYPYGDRYTWYSIRDAGGGIQGYVQAFFVDPVQGGLAPDGPPPLDSSPGAVSARLSATGTLKIRARPSPEAAELGALKRNDRIEVLEEVVGEVYNWDRKDWLRIRRPGDAPGFVGYVAGYYIDTGRPEGTAGTPAADPPDPWEQALLAAPTVGASQTTARGLGLFGIEASQALAQLDLQRVKSIAGRFASIAGKCGIPAALLAGIASRESRCGHALDSRGFGDGGKAFGIMQIDSRSHENRDISDPRGIPHIEQAAAIVNDNLMRIQARFPHWDQPYILKGAIAAYNFGVGNVRSKEGIDLKTANDDYSSDVIARAQYYYRHPELEILRD